jgi:hypothetical protein
MANATLTGSTLNPYPNGHSRLQNTDVYKGTVTLNTGTYVTNGLPFNLSGTGVQTSKTPHWGEFYSLTTGFVYRYDATYGTIRVFGASGNTAAGDDPLAELTTADTVSGDTLYFRVEVQPN